MATVHDPIMGAFITAIKAVAVAYPSIPAERIEAALAVITGAKTAIDAETLDAPRRPYTVAEAVALTGMTAQGLNNHARKGRIRRAYIAGSSRAVGYVAKDIDAIVKGETAPTGETLTRRAETIAKSVRTRKAKQAEITAKATATRKAKCGEEAA